MEYKLGTSPSRKITVRFKLSLKEEQAMDNLWLELPWWFD